MNVVALVPAAGLGSRVAGDRPKQFLQLGGMTVLARTIVALDRCPLVSSIVVAVPPGVPLGDGSDPWPSTRVGVAVVAGGPSRQESVYRAFTACAATGPDTIVLVHDAARPLVPPELVEAVALGAANTGAAIAALPASDTVKEATSEGTIRATRDRRTIFLAQTPQAFRHEVLRAAFALAMRDGFVGTDEAMLVERTGQPVHIVLGSPQNIKITTPLDLRIAEAILREREMG